MLLQIGDRNEDTRRLQAALNQLMGLELATDGIFGDGTAEAVLFYQTANELTPDGIVGDATWGHILGSTDTTAAAPVVAATTFEPWDGPEDSQPTNRSEVYAVAGNPGAEAEDKAWGRKNIVYCVAKDGFEPLPFHEDFKANYWVGVHKVVEPYLREALRRARQACPDYRITRIACYNWRTIKNPNASTPKLSMHAFGFAVDINSHDNPAKTFKRGQVPKAWSPE